LIGIDIIEIERIEAASERHPRILERLFTPQELDLGRKHRAPSSFYAGRFAAKEAVAKALRTPLGWHEVEVLTDAAGAPVVNLTGRAHDALRRLGGPGISVSISHGRDYAAAVALLHLRMDGRSTQAPQA
jgi:holo-[acyl-carrier protein] synthase